MITGDLVSIRLGREHRVAFGVLQTVTFSCGRSIGFVSVSGVEYVRDMKRIKPAAVGLKAQAKKIGQKMKRRRTL